ncbi:MAG: phospho-sugar mutase [Bacteroidaceae bacterium]|nr:phospho-sugar mutase [Bacteroidaceae bacterium]
MENEELIKQVTEKAKEWLTPAYDAQTQKEVKRMLNSEDKTELIDSFYRVLEFGTGGLRGMMGAGTNRMNIYTVGAATQGFANYLNKNFKNLDQISVVVGYDCRNNSRLFAEKSADIFSANGIKVYLFDDMRPTPEMSFAIRHLGCQAGINITASHNPREYNGYKAYWDDGAQVLAPHDKGIIDEVAKVKTEDIKFKGNPDLIQIVGKDIDDIYLEKVHSICIDPEVIKRQKDLCIVYTPLHGTGMRGIPQSLKLWGFENVHCVAEQMVKSGDFPTVVSPNPENAEALTLAIKLGKSLDADIVMASDPDADRVGMACKNDKGEWVLINGNQTCLLFLYYIITNRKKLGKMKGNEFIVKTIVTTEVIRQIAEKNHIEMRDCYTGFKWIAREIRLSEGVKQYIGGGEESYGFLAQDFVRDKDAVSACSLLAEICAWAKDQGKTLYEVLMGIYLEYGFSKEFTVNVVKPGKSGADEIQQMMANFRENPPKEIAGSKVVCAKDYKTLKATDGEGNVCDLDMPEPSNVLQYYTADGTKVSVRPSGTEPKIKFYIEVRAP